MIVSECDFGHSPALIPTISSFSACSLVRTPADIFGSGLAPLDV